MNFRVGQKVVCVDADAREWWPIRLRERDIYTIRGYGLDDNVNGAPTVFLEEVPATNEHEGYGFYADRFRPLVTRKTSIDWAITILNGSPVKEGV